MSIERRIPYKVRSFDLATARSAAADFAEFSVAEARIVVLAAPAAFKLRLGSRDADAVTIAAGTVGPIELCGREASSGMGLVYLENEAAEGTAEILTGPVLAGLSGGGAGGLEAVYDAEPAPASDGDALPLLVDDVGRLFVRLSDRLQADVDSIRVKGLPPQSDTVGVAGDATVQTLRVDSEGRPNVTASGRASAAVDWTLSGSIDGGLNWFTIKAVAGAAEFYFGGVVGVADLRLEIDPNAVATDMNAILSAQAG